MSFFNIFASKKKPSEQAPTNNPAPQQNPQTSQQTATKQPPQQSYSYQAPDIFGGLNQSKPTNNNVTAGGDNSNNNSFIAEKKEKEKKGAFTFIKKDTPSNNTSAIQKEEPKSSFTFIKQNKPEDTNPIFQPKEEPSFDLKSEPTNNQTYNPSNHVNIDNLLDLNMVEPVKPVLPSQQLEKKGNFTFIKKPPSNNSQTEVKVESEETRLKKEKDQNTNAIINNIYNTSLNFDKQSCKTVDIQNRIFDDNLMNELDKSETKSFKSQNLNNIPEKNPAEINVSVAENNNDHETSNINFQNLVSSDNFGHSSPHQPEESMFKDVQTPSTTNFNFIKKTEEPKVWNKPSFIKKKETPLETPPVINPPQKEAPVPKSQEFTETKNTLFRRTSAEDVKTPEALKKKCLEEFNRCEENIKELYLKMYRLKKKLLEKEGKLKVLNNDIEEIQLKENAAIENNDFEEAQRLENILEVKKEEIRNIKHSIKADNDEMVVFREQELFLINTKIRNSEEVIQSLGKLKNSQNYELDTFQNNDVSKHKNDQLKIKKFREKLDIIKVDIENERNFLNEEEEKVNNAIKSQSSDVFAELDEFKNSKQNVLNEIDELKRQLQLKYDELEKINKNIENKELEIDAIKSNFSHELNKISKKSARFNENKRDYEEQENQYTQMCENYASADQKILDKTSNFMKTISDLEKDISDFKLRQITLNNEVINKESLLKSENEIKSKIYLSQLNIEKIEGQKTKNNEEIQSLEINNKRLDSDISVISLKLPRLEEEKQNFVLTKNFKEAKRVAEELKTNKEEKDRLSQKTEANRNKISQLRDSNIKFDKDLEISLEEKQKEERELNVVRYQYQVLYKTQIEEMIAKLIEKNLKSDIKLFEDELGIVQCEIEQLYQHEYIRNRFKREEKVIEVKEEEKPQPESENMNDPSIHEDEDKQIHVQDDNNQIDIDDKLQAIEPEHNKEEEDNEENLSIEELNDIITSLKENIIQLDEALQITIKNEDYDTAEHIQNQINDKNVELIKRENQLIILTAKLG